MGRLSECYVAVSPGRSMSLDQLLSLGLRAGLEEGRSPSIPIRAEGNKRLSSPGKRNVGSPGKRMANSPGRRSLGNLGKRKLSDEKENLLSKRARSCAIGRRIYSEEDPVEEEEGIFPAPRSAEKDHILEKTEKINDDEEEAISSVGLIGEGSNNVERDEEDTATIFEVVPEDNGTDIEVVGQQTENETDGQRGEIEKAHQESRSREASREFSRLGRARNSVVYTESPVMEKKRMSKKEPGVRKNHSKSGRVSPLDINNQVEETLPKKKQSNVSNVKRVKEESSKKASLVKAGGSKRAMDKAEQEEEVYEASAKDFEQSVSVSRESSAGETEAEAGTSRGRRARAQVSYALPSLNSKMRRN